jgi:hypothetical protein
MIVEGPHAGQCIFRHLHYLWIPINSPAYSDPISPGAFFGLMRMFGRSADQPPESGAEMIGRFFNCHPAGRARRPIQWG